MNAIWVREAEGARYAKVARIEVFKNGFEGYGMEWDGVRAVTGREGGGCRREVDRERKRGRRKVQSDLMMVARAKEY